MTDGDDFYLCGLFIARPELVLILESKLSDAKIRGLVNSNGSFVVSARVAGVEPARERFETISKPEREAFGMDTRSLGRTPCGRPSLGQSF